MVFTSEIVAALVEVRRKADRVVNAYEEWQEDEPRDAFEDGARFELIEVHRYLLHDLMAAIHKLDEAEDQFEAYIAGILQLRES